MDSWDGLLGWTPGMDSWDGLLGRTPGIECLLDCLLRRIRSASLTASCSEVEVSPWLLVAEKSKCLVAGRIEFAWSFSGVIPICLGSTSLCNSGLISFYCCSHFFKKQQGLRYFSTYLFYVYNYKNYIIFFQSCFV